MEADTFDEGEFFSTIAKSGARALLIGRRAMIVLGLPVLTGDYDFWLHIDDIEIFNRALRSLDMVENATPAEARARGRYAIENGEHVDVLIARETRTVTGDPVRFEDLWTRREVFQFKDADVALPCLDDLIATKRLATRPKDLIDLRSLESLRRGDKV